MTTGSRKYFSFDGTLMDAIHEKKTYEKNMQIEPKQERLKNFELSFSDGIKLYFDDLYDRQKREDIDINTIYDHYKKTNLYIVPFFIEERRDLKLSQLTTKDIEDFYIYMRNRPNSQHPKESLSEKTIYNVSTTLNAILNFLASDKKIESNPAKDARNKPNPKKHKKELKYFKKQEAIYALKCLDKFADIRLKTFMNVIFSLGCRSEEVTGLRWCDIDFDEAEVNYNVAITSYVPKRFLKSDKRLREKELKTSNSYRTNFLSDKVLQLLRNYYEFQKACGFDIKDTDYIFRSWDGESVPDPHKLSEYWRKFKKQYNIKNVDLHRIRHTVANVLERKGIPKKDIAKLLGNTERVLEEYYTHVDSQELKKMRNVLDEELFEDVETIDFDINLTIKILNDYPMESFSDSELKKIDYLLDENIDNTNFESYIKITKQLILNSNAKLIYFIDDNKERLETKIECYKLFTPNSNVGIRRAKDVVITKNVFEF